MSERDANVPPCDALCSPVHTGQKSLLTRTNIWLKGCSRHSFPSQMTLQESRVYRLQIRTVAVET